MAAGQDAALLDRLARLERELSELRARVVALERLVGTSGEHPSDSSIVRQKVSYDWQG